MRSYVAAGVALLAVGSTASPAQKTWEWKPKRNPAYPPDIVDKLLDASIPKLEAWMAKKAAAGNTKCTLANAAVRREWSDLSVAEREDYIKAVLCLQSKPSKAPKGEVPGALSRFDDFVATHMMQSPMLHSPTHLFNSHKYYIWAYEQALRNECGYKGYQPYMNYDRYAADPINSPMFNGNSSSMGGNGAPTAYGGIKSPFKKPHDKIQSGGGGGCVTSGPFKDMVVSLGPKSTVVDGIPANPRWDGLGSNPRCLRRDVNKYSAFGARANYTYSLIMDHPEIDAFYNRYLGQPQLENDMYPWGLHIAGHFMIGGDPGGDFYASPGDPAFYFHHGMLDRIWWIWQLQDPDNRVPMIPTMGDQPEGASDIIIDLQWSAPPVPLPELNDQLGGNYGQFCYIYV